MRELLETPKAMSATTELEMTNVNAEKIHGLVCELENSQMGNQQPSQVEDFRTCRVCDETKSINEFRLYKNRNSVYRSKRCVSCTVAYHRDYFQKDKERFNNTARNNRRGNLTLVRTREAQWAKGWREKARNQVYKAYGDKCACCGETETLFLTIDHVNNDGHIERKNHSQGNLYSRIIRANFPDSYQLLCWNCNTGKRRNNGVCPHQKGSTTIAQASRTKRSEALIPGKPGEDMVSTFTEMVKQHKSAGMK